MNTSNRECVEVTHTCGHVGLYWVDLGDKTPDDFRDFMELRPCHERCPSRPRVRRLIERLFGRPEV